MNLLVWLERQLAASRLSIALATPVVVFVLLDLATQIIVRQLSGADSSIFLWEWQAIVIPLFIFLAGYAVTMVAVVAQMRRWGWWRLLESNRSLDAIRSLNWGDFERLVAAAFTEKGWNPELVQGAPDGGVDLILRKGKQQAIVQCKQRRFPTGAYVTELEVRQFAGIITARKAVKGYLVTSGVFAPEATEFGEKIPQMDMIDGNDLLAMVGRCPKCKAGLQPKHSKYGLSLSCVRFPDCDGALNLAA